DDQLAGVQSEWGWELDRYFLPGDHYGLCGAGAFGVCVRRSRLARPCNSTQPPTNPREVTTIPRPSDHPTASRNSTAPALLRPASGMRPRQPRAAPPVVDITRNSDALQAFQAGAGLLGARSQSSLGVAPPGWLPPQALRCATNFHLPGTSSEAKVLGSGSNAT